MKKNYLFGLCAAGMLLMTSCQKDGLLGGMWQDNQEPVTVKMNVSLPEMQSASRAAIQFGNGHSAQHLNYAVYEIMTEPTGKTDENGKPVYMDVDTIFLEAQEVRDAKMEGQLSKTIALKLMTGSTYEVVFWAQHHAQNEETAPYTCVFDKVEGKAVVAEVTLDYSKMYSNQEDYDAFFGKVRIDNVTPDKGSVKDLGTVYLYRPFAQLNIGTGDLDAAEKAGFKVEKVAVEVSNGVFDVLNLWTGMASNSEKATANKAYKQNAIVNPELYAFPIASYNDGEKDIPLTHVAMNYLLMQADKETVNKVTLKYYDTNGREKTREFNTVPAQRNYRTNIYGDLLTSDMKVKVTINPIFEDDYNEPRNNE